MSTEVPYRAEIRPGETKTLTCKGCRNQIQISMPDQAATKTGRVFGFLVTFLIGLPVIVLAFLLVIYLVIRVINAIAETA